MGTLERSGCAVPALSRASAVWCSAVSVSEQATRCSSPVMLRVDLSFPGGDIERLVERGSQLRVGLVLVARQADEPKWPSS